MAIATSTAIALALAAAAAGASYYNTTSTAKKQDREAAAGIRRQAQRQQQADASVDKAIQAQAGSSGADEKAGVLEQYMQQVRSAKAGSTSGLSQTGNVSDRAREAETNAALGVGNFGEKIAGLMAAMDAPQLQRQNEAVNRARTAVDLEGIGRNASGDAFLNQLRLQGIRRNPYLDAFSSFAGGAAGSIGTGGGGGATQSAGSYGSGFGSGLYSGARGGTDMSDPYQGFAVLADALFGGRERKQAAYQEGMRGAAQTDAMLADAFKKRKQAMAVSNTPGAVSGTGLFTPEVADFISNALIAGYDPRQVSGYSGDMQRQGLIGEGAVAARGGNIDLLNNITTLLEGKPRLRTQITQGMAFDPYAAPTQGMQTTPVAAADIAKTFAEGRMQDAAAAENYAQASAQNALAAKYARTDPNIRAGGGAGGGSNTLAPDVMEMFKEMPARAAPGTKPVFNQRKYEDFLAWRAQNGGTGNLSNDARQWLLAPRAEKPWLPPIIIDPTDPASMLQRPPAPAKIPPPQHIQMLRANPNLRGYFDQTYGPGAADRVLGGLMSNPFEAPMPAPVPRQPRQPIDADAIRRGAQELGIDPVDLATAISYETAGTFDPDKRGPTTKWGQHQGLIQFGEPQRARYGVRPGMTVAEQMPAVVAYLRDAGVQPGMGMLDVYSAINAGRVGRYNASDALAGGMPGTVADKVNFQMADHRAKAMRVLGEGGGGGGGYPAMPSANPFEQTGGMPDLSGALSGPNPFDQFDAPDFSDVQTVVSSTESGAQASPPRAATTPASQIPTDGDYRDVFAPDDPSSFGKIGLRALVGRVPELVANFVDLPGNVAGAIGDTSPTGSKTMTVLREVFGRGADAIRNVGYERDMQQAGYGVPSVSGGQVLDALNPTADVSIGDRAARVGRFIPETLLASSPDMAAAVGALPAYIAARTNEVAANRAANDQRANPSVSDLAIAAPAATAESLLERLTTMRLLPGGGAIARPGVAGAAGRVAKETGIQGASGAVEEALPYIAETLGTETPTTGRGIAEALATGLVAEGGLGGAAQGASEVASAATRPRTAASPADPVNIADIVEQAKAILPAVAAEGQASPRQDAAPAAPPTPPPADQPAPQEVQAQPEPAGDAGAPAPDMSAATRSIDDRLAALDEAAAAQIDEAEVSALNAERQELDDLVREQDRARREGIVQPLEARLSPEERATADSRRQEIAATLERHRAARTAADQAKRLRSRLEAADTDAALYEVAREINPTLGTPQADSFRTAQASGTVPGPRDVPAAPGPDSVSGPPEPATPSVPAPVDLGTGQNAPNVADIPSRTPANVSEQQRAPAASAPPAAPRRATETPEAPAPAPEVAPAASEAPRAEAQRQPAAEPVPGQTSLKNAVTDAERIAEGRDPIIRKMRRANPKAVDEAVEALRETPSLGREVAERLSNGGPATPQDKAVLIVHKVNLRKRRDAAAERAQAPNVSEEAKAEATREYNDLVQQIDTVDQAARFSASDAGWMLQFQKVMIAEDYSLPALERKLKMVVNRDLKPAERAELAEMAEKVATLQRKLDAVESQQASAQVAEMLARLMKQAPGRGATLAQRRTAAAESKAALSAMAQTGGQQQSIAPATGQPGQARAALAERLGRGVVARLERAGVLEFDDRNGGAWDGVRIGIGNVAPENALGVLLHEVTHANMLDVLGEQGYERALRDLDALEAAGDRLALRAKRRAEKSGETGARLDDERIAYMVEEATNAQKQAGTLPAKVTDFLRSIVSAFRRWAATSAVFRALERAGINRPTLRPDDFVAFARRGLDRMVSESRDTVSAGLRKKVSGLERDLRTSYLTGLPNRRKFDEDAALGWPTVAFFDVDTFKKLNDAVGHDTADVVLKAIGDEVSNLASDTVRPYHASGDEFLFRFKSAADARPVMDALQQALEDVVVELEATTADGESKFYEYQGIGISYGVGKNYDQADADAKRQKTPASPLGSAKNPVPMGRLDASANLPPGRVVDVRVTRRP